MNKKLIQYSLAIVAALFVANSCNKKETTTNDNSEVVIVPSDSLIADDSEILSDDSATVKTAVGVQDEEQNAIKKEKSEAEKLNEDREGKKQFFFKTFKKASKFRMFFFDLKFNIVKFLIDLIRPFFKFKIERSGIKLILFYDEEKIP